jgi:hypothetical protein
MISEIKTTRQYRKDYAVLNSIPARRLSEKMASGDHMGSLTAHKLRTRFFTENAKALMEAAEEQRMLKEKKYKCACGNYKKARYDKCYKCSRFGKK